jgi:hypothetical protein
VTLPLLEHAKAAQMVGRRTVENKPAPRMIYTSDLILGGSNQEIGSMRIPQIGRELRVPCRMCPRGGRILSGRLTELQQPALVMARLHAMKVVKID